jgi:erythronate-4-phosphate dehydrogenase
MHILQNDPPLARSTGSSSFLPLDSLMDADIITLHVPLTKTGSDPTFHLFDESRINKMKKGAVLFNTARGPVVDGGALKNAIERKHLGGALLDVWEGEPLIDIDLMKMVDIGTSHIAGYSFDGKLAAVKMTYSAACKFFGQPELWTPGNSLPKPSIERIVVPNSAESAEDVVRTIVSKCYDIEYDDRALRSIAGVSPNDRRLFFSRLRAEYRIRREFFTTLIELPPSQAYLLEPLRSIGFRVEAGRT